MVFTLKSDVKEEKISQFIANWEKRGFLVILNLGAEHKTVCLIGNTKELDLDFEVKSSDIVEYAQKLTEEYKAVNRIFHKDSTLVPIGGTTVGEGTFTVIAGPCSVESE